MDDTVEQSKAPLMEHLIELRKRLMISIAVLIVSFFVAFPFADHIFNFMVEPLNQIWQGQEGRRIIYTALHEKFFVDVKVAFFAGFCVSFPIVAGQFYMFIAPGLYKHEKQSILPFLIATPFLFAAGASFVYYVILPVAWEFFTSFEQIAANGNLAVVLEPKANEYLSLVMRLIFAFGISFELPVVLSLLVKAGITSAAGLRNKRRYAILIAFIAAAILTPPDPLSQIGLALPIIFLYEISIICAVIIQRQKRKHEESLDPDDDDPDDEVGGVEGEDNKKTKPEPETGP